MSLTRHLRATVQRHRQNRELRLIYDQFAAFTMIPESLYTENLRLALRVRGVEGCVVECGVWKGGMMAGLARLLGPQRSYYLCDSFEGLPEAASIDGAAAKAWQADEQSPNHHDNCRAPEQFAQEAMRRSGSPSYHLVRGWFSETLPRLEIEPIALLRLDADWYGSTMDCLCQLYDRVVPGGLILIDDYYTWDGCSRALHAFLAQRLARERISTSGSVCFIEKMPPEHPAEPPAGPAS